MKLFQISCLSIRKYRYHLLKQTYIFLCISFFFSYWELPKIFSVKQKERFDTTENSFDFNLRLKKLMSPYTSHIFCHPSLNSPTPLNSSYPYISPFEKVLFQNFILDYSEFHKFGKRKTLSKYLIFRPHPTGLGDRFERLVTAYYVAVVTGRIFLVDWRRPFPIEDLWTSVDPKLDFYIRNSDQSQLKETTRKHIIDNSKHNKSIYIDRLLSQEKVLVITISERPARSTLEHLGNLRFGQRGSAQWTSFLGNYICRRALMHHVFQVNNLMKQQFSEVAYNLNLWSSKYNLASTFQSSKTFNKYISVHARFGEGVGEKDDPRFELALSSIENPLRCLAKRAVELTKVRGLSSPIFFASDTPKARNLFTKLVKELTDRKYTVVYGDWETFHSNHIDRGRGVEKGIISSVKKKRTAMWGIYMDLMILAYSEHIISLKSSFPRLAFSMGTSKTITELHIDNCSNPYNFQLKKTGEL